MCDIEEFILQHQDISSKYSEFADNMDLYITDSLQDMLDMDIKTEMATDLGSATDFSEELGLSFSEMSPLLDIEPENSVTPWTTNTNSSFVHNLDLYGSEANAVMVNPNSVMPSMFSETPIKNKIVNESSSHLMLNGDSVSPLPSPKEEKSHLTFSPNTIKVPKIKEEVLDEIKSEIKEETSSPMVIYVRKDAALVKKDLSNELDSKKIKLASSVQSTPIRIKPMQELIKLNKNCSILNTSNQKITSAQLGAKTIISGNIHILGAQHSRTLLANASKNQATILIDNGSLNNNRQLIKTTVANAFTIDNSQNKYSNSGSNNKYSNNNNFPSEFPKPAYSYSCLIAMALKNSKTGSLPVSEIYNFMCQHFPYFKTAPNGWKNSVRHNLSLNKCFEKIEKPTTNGGQRKGCLWAMNPSKIGKMDEEVLKWSRKDPQAIKKAMVYPESLEALERGEMKYSSGTVSDQEMTDGDEADIDPDADIEDDEEQDGSDQELEVDHVVGDVNVDGTYRLVTNSTSYINDNGSSDLSDIEVMDTLDNSEFDLSKPFKVELAVDSYEDEVPTKKMKSSFIYQPLINSAPHTNRRKTPLVNRIA